MRTYWITSAIVVLALSGAIPALAQDAFRFTSPVDVAIGRDYGFLVSNQKLTDTIMVVRPPQLTFTNESPRSNFIASYQPEIELFHNNSNLNAFNNTGSANFTFRITQRLHFNASDDALTTEDPTRSIPGILMFLPRREFRQNAAHAAINYALSHRNTVSFSFDNVAASAPLNTLAFPETGHVISAGTVAFAHAFKPKQTVTATYSALSAGAQFIGAAYESEFAHDLTVHLSAGLLKDSGENYLLSAQVEKRVGAVWVNGGYHRFLSVFGSPIEGAVPIGNNLLLPTGVSSTDVYQVFSAGVAGQLSRRTGVELQVAATKNNSGIADRNINNISSRIKLSYGLTDRLKMYTDFQLYSQTYNVFIGTPIDRTRYMAGLQFDLSPHPNRVSNFPEQTKPTPK